MVPGDSSVGNRCDPLVDYSMDSIGLYGRMARMACIADWGIVDCVWDRSPVQPVHRVFFTAGAGICFTWISCDAMDSGSSQALILIEKNIFQRE